MSKNLLFDYDGTLHESIRIYAPAFRKAQTYLAENGLRPDARYTDTEISRWLGCSAPDMWRSFAPELAEAERQRCSGIIGDEMVRLTRLGRAALYPGVPEMLLCLKERGYTLILLSNCKRAYMDAHRRAFSLGRCFEAFYCSEDYSFAPKTEIFGVIAAHHPGSYAVIGDRHHDMDIAAAHGLFSVGCLYGYGTADELSGANAFINSPSELTNIFL